MRSCNAGISLWSLAYIGLSVMFPWKASDITQMDVDHTLATCLSCSCSTNVSSWKKEEKGGEIIVRSQ